MAKFGPDNSFTAIFLYIYLSIYRSIYLYIYIYFFFFYYFSSLFVRRFSVHVSFAVVYWWHRSLWPCHPMHTQVLLGMSMVHVFVTCPPHARGGPLTRGTSSVWHVSVGYPGKCGGGVKICLCCQIRTFVDFVQKLLAQYECGCDFMCVCVFPCSWCHKKSMNTSTCKISRKNLAPCIATDQRISLSVARHVCHPHIFESHAVSIKDILIGIATKRIAFF